MYKGAVFFDYDGTLADISDGISYPTEKTLESLKKLRENGYITVLCTGRPLCYAEHVAKLFDVAATLNGMYIAFGEKVILDNPSGEELSAKLLNYMDSRGINYTADAPDICYCTDLNAGGFLEWTEMFGIDRSYFTDDVAFKPKRVYKISVLFDKKEQCFDMRAHFNGVFNIDMQTDLFGDICMCEAGKDKAVLAVCEYFGIPFENTYAFGDGENDAAMFEKVAHAVAMEKHSPKLDKYAEFFTKTVRNDGVSYALSRYGII